MKVSGHGHLFQDRYKSIVCDGDSYFTELVRYIHLNPLRMKLVRDLKELKSIRIAAMERSWECRQGRGKTARVCWRSLGGELPRRRRRTGDLLRRELRWGGDRS